MAQKDGGGQLGKSGKESAQVHFNKMVPVI